MNRRRFLEAVSAGAAVSRAVAGTPGKEKPRESLSTGCAIRTRTSGKSRWSTSTRSFWRRPISWCGATCWPPASRRRSRKLSKGAGPIPREHIERTSGEHEQMLELLDSVRRDGRRWYSVNIPNNRAVANLPKDAVVEIPGLATAKGVVAPPVGELPPGITAVLLHRFAAIEAIVEAAVTGSRKLLVEALLLDGGVSDHGDAVKLAEALVKAQAEHLPQFAG